MNEEFRLNALSEAHKDRQQKDFKLDLPYVVKGLKHEAQRIQGIWDNSGKTNGTVSDPRYSVHIQKLKHDALGDVTAFKASYLKPLPEG